MDITAEQMPPPSRPPAPEKGVPVKYKPDTGSKTDLINPDQPKEGNQPVDPIPDMDPGGQDPEGEAVN